MKPHDEWNSADIADHARRAMHMETTQYGDEPPRPRPMREATQDLAAYQATKEATT